MMPIYPYFTNAQSINFKVIQFDSDFKTSKTAVMLIENRLVVAKGEAGWRGRVGG